MFSEYAVNEILGGESDSANCAVMVASTIIALDSFPRGIVAFTTTAQKKAGEIFVGGERVAVKFLSSEIPCSCLEQKLSELKAMPKISCCTRCRKRDVKSKIMECSICRVTQYCSKKCQRDDWPEHKLLCKQFALITAVGGNSSLGGNEQHS